MSIELVHQDPDFEIKKRAYFQNFILLHLPQARQYAKNGLLVEEGARKYRNIAKHQLLSAVMTETVSELLGMPKDKTEQLTNLSLTHDVDKRRQFERMSKAQIIGDEQRKNKRPLVATSSNFTGFDNWGLDEYILRYVDSSVGEKPGQLGANRWLDGRDLNNPPDVVILPWKQRVESFKIYKIEEGEKGMPLYEMSTWDKLEEIMSTVEIDLHNKIIQNHPELAARYPDHSQLTELIENRIHEKILSQ